MAALKIDLGNLTSRGRYKAGRRRRELAIGEKQIPLFKPSANGNGQAAFRDPAFVENKSLPVHRWVPWIAGYSASFVDDAIATYLGPGRSGLVLDPFCGVGTTLLQAVIRGHDAVGFEINRRSREHSDSIQQTNNLSITDFGCRYLIVDDIWIPLGESLLISMFSPLWNQLLDGFGNHDPGAGRYNQQRSAWDVIHPGRPWAEKLKANLRSEGEILKSIAEFLK